jgi:hypothetical protein
MTPPDRFASVSGAPSQHEFFCRHTGHNHREATGSNTSPQYSHSMNPRYPPLMPTPREIRAALNAEQYEQFNREWEAAIDEAMETFDLSCVEKMLDRWQRITPTAPAPQAEPPGVPADASDA